MAEQCFNCGKSYDRESDDIIFKEYTPIDGTLKIYPWQEPDEIYKKCPHCLANIEG